MKRGEGRYTGLKKVNKGEGRYVGLKRVSKGEESEVKRSEGI